MDFPAPDDPCVFCRQTPASGAWNSPCTTADDGLHYTAVHLAERGDQARDALGTELVRMLPILVDAIADLHAHGRRRYKRSPEFSDLILRADDSVGRASDMLELYGVAKFPLDPIKDAAL